LSAAGSLEKIMLGKRIVCSAILMLACSLGADKTGTQRIAHAYKNNRQGADFRLNNRRHQVSIGDPHVWCEAHQFHKGGAYPAGIRARKTNVNADVAPFLPTQLLQFLPQRRDLSLCRRIGLGIPHQHADPAHALCLLRAPRTATPLIR